MLARVAIAGAGVIVAAYSVVVGEWLGLAAVVVVLAAVFRWRPSWLRVDLPGDAELSDEELALRLIELRRWRRVLVPIACAAVVVQVWALHRFLTTSTLRGTAILTSVVSSLLVAWAAVAQRRIEKLEG